jgi:hypothetical protein
MGVLDGEYVVGFLLCRGWNDLTDVLSIGFGSANLGKVATFSTFSAFFAFCETVTGVWKNSATVAILMC